MIVDNYVDGPHSMKPSALSQEDVDLIKEVSTMNRVEIDTEGHEEKVSIKYRPDEIIGYVVDDDEWDEMYMSPVETTVMVVDEEELLDHETIANRERK